MWIGTCLGAWIAGCAEPVSPDPPVFDGIRSLAWDGADGLVAGWDPVGGIERYEVVVETPDGGAVASVEVDGDTATIDGLPDGEYTVRVDPGARTLAQYVGANRLVLRSFTRIRGIGSVWGDGDLVVLGGRSSGASFRVYDLSDPRAPVLLHTEVGSGFTKEVKLGDDLLFTQGECGCGTREGPEWEAYDKVGVRIWDLADPSSPELVGTIGDPVSVVHNLWYQDGWLYVTDYEADGVRIYDVSEPAVPREVWSWVPSEGFVHDQVVVRDRLYVSWWKGLTVFDVADPTAPVEIGTFTGLVPALHNAWPTDDDRYVYTTSEIPGGGLSILDFADPSAPERVGDVEGTVPASSVHNVAIRDGFAYTAWYAEGVVVHDLSDPLHPREVGRYDTAHHDGAETDPAEPFSGAWGVWPFGEHLVVADSLRGMFVFDRFPEIVTAE